MAYHIVEIIPNEDGPCGDHPTVISWTHRAREGILFAPYAVKLAGYWMEKAARDGYDAYFEARDEDGRKIHFANYQQDAHMYAYRAQSADHDYVPF